MSRRLTFPSIEAFYQDDERRRTSRERDYGTWWKETDADAYGPWWRVSAVKDTRELYAVCLSGVWGEYSEQVELLANNVSYCECDLLLGGWGGVIGGPQSLQWVRRMVVERLRSR